MERVRLEREQGICRSYMVHLQIYLTLEGKALDYALWLTV